MYLKEIILDGFKSYAHRTVISGLDPQFNAISGANGSGKSAILDAVCFVLGISNLSQVRVSSLQELVYKNGQAGVTKASATLVFDNSVPSASPVGYEHCREITVTRQVVMGGRSKYLVNGHVAQPGRVHSLFHSVQLNVNNPHFLIMQGRITKVINMKPIEVLHMLEEAAGTSMYEMKKESALRTIEKKQRKVDEINSLLAEEITPSLEKLREERTRYMRWSSNQAEMERLTRLLVVREHAHLARLAHDFEGERAALEAQLATLASDKADLEERLRQLRTSLSDRQVRASKQDADEERALEAQLSDWEKQLVKGEAELGFVRENADGEERAAAEARRACERLTQQLSEVERRRVEAAMQLEQAEAAHTAAAEALRQLREATAISSHAEQLAQARHQAAEAATAVKSTELALAAKRQDLARLGKRNSRTRNLEAEVARAEKAVAQVKVQLHELDYDQHAAQRLQKLREADEHSVRRLRDQYDALASKLCALEFDYADPTDGFDRSRVQGVVARRVALADGRYATAIEVAAGAKLYQVIVDTEQTGKLLLERGQLRRRVTLIPLNKIDARVLGSAQVQRAQALGSQLALALVQYDSELENAMRYVFGRCLVCDDMDTARRTAFDSQVQCRTVTVDGDVFDPQGTVSGGARERGTAVLTRIAELNEVAAELQLRERALAKTYAELAAVEAKADTFAALTAQLERRQHELQAVQAQVDADPQVRLSGEVAQLEAQLRTVRERLRSAEQRLTAMDSGADLRGQDAAAAAEATETAERARNASIAAVERSEAELARLRTELAEASARAVEADAAAGQLRTQQSALQRRIDDELRPACTQAREQLQSFREAWAARREAAAALSTEVQTLQSQLETAMLEERRVEHRLHGMRAEHDTAQQRLAQLQREHGWLATVTMSSTAVEGGIDDDEAAHIREQLARLGQETAAMARHVNKRALALFEKSEQEYQDLMNKKRIIETDKQKIYAAIRALDEKKRAALQATWRRVNQDLGDIFATLLPGAQARLDLPEGASSVLEGLEIRVAMGAHWKASLSELSGGQRSLIALSLVLAMLKFKPAPMYVLDEVDAALDLNHTQNVGRIIREHFGGSQFIVVSLKPALFEHANVVFTTRLEHGTSAIHRRARREEERGSGGVAERMNTARIASVEVRS
ncbi:hypothetical protein CDCA_CDCA13G3563 [Cyanidium caldarium]|uniref:SMC hinge domain-containing protein n=1 Tax=Cyanidium caldarium TaxID=2771 RepID=A0AAV9IYX9_CYACA|nr:hypothetical protein CDCA_CDCA13G3563 [Cyanidium caldarium]